MKKTTVGNFLSTPLYKGLVEHKTACYFISPHLDDAVFSCASLLSNLVKSGVPVTILNVFSEASQRPYTLSVHKFLWQCGYTDAGKLFKDRRMEDAQVIEQLGAKVSNLGFVDALWRRHKVRGVVRLLSRVIAELNYVYPVYRFGLAQGIISAHDAGLGEQISQKLKRVIPPLSKSMIFCPLAIGRHVDHLIVRDACKTAYNPERVAYWSDYPYEQQKPMEDEFIKNNALLGYAIKKNTATKNALINGYKSQLQVIFGGLRDHSQVIETYYIHKQ